MNSLALGIQNPLNRKRPPIPLPVRFSSPLVWRESGGAAAGAPQDASQGLAVQTLNGQTWAYNTAVSPAQWMLVYKVTSLPQGLWGLSQTMYGTASTAGVNAIYNVPQNKAIQGSDPNTGLIPGDVILIPNLSPSGSLTVPSSGGGATVLPTTVVPGDVPNPNPGGASIVPASNGGVATTAPKFWTSGRIAVAGILGAGGLGLVTYMLMKKKKRRR